MIFDSTFSSCTRIKVCNLFVLCFVKIRNTTDMTYPSRFTEFFGPNLWKVMHAISFTYPDDPTEEQAQQYKDFFLSLAPVIPCPGCGIHYKKYLDEHPIQLTNTESLSKWVYNLHDTVNKRNNKPSPSYEEIKKDYAGFDEEANAKLLSLPDDEQRIVMADPFLGRMGSLTGGCRYQTKALLLLVVALLGAYGLYVLKQKRDAERNAERKA